MLIVYAVLLALTGWRLAGDARPASSPTQDQGNLSRRSNCPPAPRWTAPTRSCARSTQVCLRRPGVLGASRLRRRRRHHQHHRVQRRPDLPDAGAVRRTDEAGHDRRQRSSRICSKRLGRDHRRGHPLHPAAAGARHRLDRRLQDDRRGPGRPRLRRRWRRSTNELAEAANQDPALADTFATFNTRTPRIFADIDRAKAELLGVPDSECSTPCRPTSARPSSTTSTCSATPSRSLAQADAPFRSDPSAIAELQTRSASGAMVPLGSVVNLSAPPAPTGCCATISIPAAEIQGDSAPGYSSGQSMAAMERLAQERLPAGLRLRMDRTGLPAEAGRQHRHAGLRAGGGVRLPAAGRALRERDPAVRGDPDRADVPAGGHGRASICGAWTTTS